MVNLIQVVGGQNGYGLRIGKILKLARHQAPQRDQPKQAF